MSEVKLGLDLVARLQQSREEETKLSWQRPFVDYCELVKANPRIASLSHARVYDMISKQGTDVDLDGKKRYRFFESELFGLEEPINQVVDYFSSAAKRLEVRKRILLLMGPVGGGKSTMVTMLKRGLEQYTRKDEGAVYAISGCPMHEEPLHLVPEELRPAFSTDLNVHIEGDLCPSCRLMVQDKYGGKVEDVLVERIAFSEKNRIGIGTFSPSDPKSQDISELTGSIDLATVGEYGSESDPRAYRFDGELNIANRGVMEFIEMLKSDERFLYHLLTLSQEQNIKTGRFAMIYADEVILSHTNENEYNTFIANKRSEALHDRMILVRVPYNLKLSEEVKIYEKLIKQSALRDVHVAPETLRTASMVAVLSRLAPSKKAGMTLMKKMKLYDGEEVEGFSQKEVREMQEAPEAEREGMDGISPRLIINALSQTFAEEGVKCVNPINALKAIRRGIDQHSTASKEQKEAWFNLIANARIEHDDFIKQEVQKAFVYSFDESAETLLANYLDNVEAYKSKTKLKDPITEEEVEPDEKLMRSLEEQIGVQENGKNAFREEVLIRLAGLARRGERFRYTSHPRLKEAIEKKLLVNLQDAIKITTSTKTPDKDQQSRIKNVAELMINKHGYCSLCANETLKYVGALLNR